MDLSNGKTTITKLGYHCKYWSNLSQSNYIPVHILAYWILLLISPISFHSLHQIFNLPTTYQLKRCTIYKPNFLSQWTCKNKEQQGDIHNFRIFCCWGNTGPTRSTAALLKGISIMSIWPHGALPRLPTSVVIWLMSQECQYLLTPVYS